VANVEKEVTINASIEKVFRYISEPSNLPEIWPSLVEIKNVQSLPNGGYKVKYEYKMAGMRFKGIGEYTQIVPNQWFVIETKGGISSTITWTFRSSKDRTRVTLTIEYKIPVPVLGKLAEAIIAQMNDQEADLIMSHLRIRLMMPSH